jgi:hypothetical protein
MSLYRSIVRQSFIVAWKHKYLWFFGLFASILVSNFEVGLINHFTNKGSSTIYDWKAWAETGIFSPQAWSNFIELIRIDTWSFISLVLVFLVLLALLLALLWLSVVSQGGLVNNVSRALAEGSKSLTKAEKKHDTAVGFREGKKKFWPLLWLNILVRVIVYVLALITIAPIVVSAKLNLTMAITYYIVFILLLLVSLVLAFITKYAITYIILKDKSFGQSIVSAWRLFKDNWLVSLEMTLILFAISIVFSLGLILAVLVLAIPLTILYVISVLVGSFPIFFAIIILGVILSLAIIVIGGAFLTVIQTTAWVSLFNQLTVGKGPESKLERVFGKIL